VNEQYLIEIEKSKQMIHQGNIFDQCSIGGDKNNYYQSRGLKGNELLIREIGGVYNIVANSENWSLNGKKLIEKKYYILGAKNKLKSGKYIVNIKKVRDDSTGGLELESEKKDIHDLIGSNKKQHSNVDIYNSPKSESSSKSQLHHQYLKKIGLFSKLSLNFFNFTMFYLVTWLILPLLSSTSNQKYIDNVQAFIINNIQKIDSRFVLDGQLQLMQEGLKDLPSFKQYALIADQLAMSVFLGFLVFFSIKMILAFLIGRPFAYLFLGLGIDGGFVIKRVKSALLELLNPLLAPLSFYRLWGLLPFRTIPEVLLRVAIFRTSSVLGLIGPIYLSLITLALIAAPLIHQQIDRSTDITIQDVKIRKKSKQSIHTQTLIFSNHQLDIPLDKSMQVSAVTSKKGNRYKVSGGKLKKSIIFSPTSKSLTSWKKSIATGNPLGFLMYPVHALKNVNLPIPQGNAQLFQAERIDMINVALSLKLKNITQTIFELGPFLSGTYFFAQELKQNLELLQGTTIGYWIKNNGSALLLAGENNAILAYPLDINRSSILINASSKKDLIMFIQHFIRNQTPVKMPAERNGLLDEVLELIEKLQPENITNNFKHLINGSGGNVMKKVQNQQKELTNSIKKANKAKEDILKEVDSE
jgi:hypothetical protein